MRREFEPWIDDLINGNQVEAGNLRNQFKQEEGIFGESQIE